jgi:hypothetical protein
MQGTLGFKRSLFAGVHDGGEREVFLGGSRLKRFMESVEKVTGEISESTAEEVTEPSPPEPEAEPAPPEVEADEAPPPVASPVAADPLASLLEAGLEIARQFASAAGSAPDKADAKPAAGPPPRFLERIRDEQTGQSYLKVRMPEPEVVDRVAQAVQALLESLKR